MHYCLPAMAVRDGGSRSKGPQNDESRRAPIWAVVSARKARYLKAKARSDAKRVLRALLRRPKLQRWR